MASFLKMGVWERVKKMKIWGPTAHPCSCLKGTRGRLHWGWWLREGELGVFRMYLVLKTEVSYIPITYSKYLQISHCLLLLNSTKTRHYYPVAFAPIPIKVSVQYTL